MIDHLDIAAAVREGQQRRRMVRRWRVIGVVLVVLVVLGAQGLAAIALRPVAQLYTLDGVDWREITLPEGESPYQILPASDGGLWVGTRSDCGFLRYQNAAWSACSGGGDPPPYFGGNSLLSAIDGDQLWTVRDNAVLHYDGTQWITYANVLAGYSVNDIEASPLGVFIINTYGLIFTFDGSNWSRQQLSALIPTSSLGGIYASSAELVKTPDGTIYLAYNGALFRYDGQSWQPFGGTTRLIINRLYAATDELIWVYENSRGVGTLNLSGPLTFSRKSLGIPAMYPDQLLLVDGIPTMTTYLGIYQWERNRWRILTTPPSSSNAYSYQNALSVDNSGNFWWIAHTQSFYDPFIEARRDIGRFMRYGWWIIALGGLMLLTLIRPGAGQRARVTQRLVWAARFDVPDLVTLQVGGGLYRLWPSLFVLMILMAVLIYAWGQFRSQDGYTLLAAALPLIGLGLPVAGRWRGYLPARRSITIEDHTLLLAYRLLAALVIGLVLYLPVSTLWTLTGLSGGIGALLYPLGVLYLSWQALRWWMRRSVDRAVRLIEQKEFPAAEAQIAWLEQYLPLQAHGQLLRGDLAHGRGDLNQAAWFYRRALYEYQAVPPVAARVLRSLAAVLGQQGRGDRALPLSECAIHIQPESAASYAALAAHYQQQAVEPERAQSLLVAAQTFGK